MEIGLQVDDRLVTMAPEAIVVAGFTGRDERAVRQHVQELADQGVPAPPTTPAFYVMPPSALTCARELHVVRARTSGEAEIALVVEKKETYVTLASDHTDRDVETLDIALSKEVCSKPIARHAWRLDDVADHWAGLRLRSWARDGSARRLYQDGFAVALLPPDELLAKLPQHLWMERFVLLMGTLPTRGGIRPATHFWAELTDPQQDRRINLEYAVRTLGSGEARP
jgi:hypothetical protein